VLGLANAFGFCVTALSHLLPPIDARSVRLRIDDYVCSHFDYGCKHEAWINGELQGLKLCERPTTMDE
jgi:hypothetical protein